MIESKFRFHCYMLHKKIMGYYNPTSHRMCGFLGGVHRQSMSSPWEPVGDYKIDRKDTYPELFTGILGNYNE